MLHGPILPTLLRMAVPNLLALTVGACVVIAETSYVGRLGTEPLAAVALCFPFLMLNMTMAGGALGGAVASAVARALGAGDAARATALAIHALIISLLFAAFFAAIVLTFGSTFLYWLGGRGGVLKEAVSYLHMLFAGIWLVWLMNTTASVIRGTGNMKLPATMQLNSAICQIVLGGILSLGLGPIPSFGLYGIAWGTLIAFGSGSIVLNYYFWSGRGRLKPVLREFRIQRSMFADIMKVALVACFSPLQNVLTILLFAHFLAHFGKEALAGYGIAQRLEFLLTTISYSIGMASVPMVGMAIGAGLIARARRVAFVSCCAAVVSTGALGTLFAVYPWLWLSMFTSNPEVHAVTSGYLSIAGPLFSFIGLALVCYASSQGAAKVFGPVLAQTGRLIFTLLGGWLLIAYDASVTAFFILSAMSMVVLGVSSASATWMTRWEPKRPQANSAAPRQANAGVAA